MKLKDELNNDVQFNVPVQTGGVVRTDGNRTSSAPGALIYGDIDEYGALYRRLVGSNGRAILTTTVTFEPATPTGTSPSLLGVQNQPAKLHRATGTHNTLRDPTASIVSRILSSAASVELHNLGAFPFKLFRAFGRSARATACYLKIYNTNAPVVGTTAPVMTIEIPATARFDIDLGGWQSLAAGCSYAFTTGAADNDASVLTAGDIICFNLIYG